MREQEYFLWVSVPIQHYFYAFMPGGDYDVCNEKAFLGPEDIHRPTAPLQVTSLTLLAAAGLPQPFVRSLVCQTPVNSGAQPGQLRNSGCQTGKRVTVLLKCLSWETKTQNGLPGDTYWEHVW